MPDTGKPRSTRLKSERVQEPGRNAPAGAQRLKSERVQEPGRGEAGARRSRPKARRGQGRGALPGQRLAPLHYVAAVAAAAACVGVEPEITYRRGEVTVRVPGVEPELLADVVPEEALDHVVASLREVLGRLAAAAARTPSRPGKG